MASYGIKMAEFIQVITSVDSAEKAVEIAQRLLKQRLAACVQVLGPVRSRYWWQGEFEEAEEWLCLIKARATDYAQIESAIQEVHPYTVPEILALPITAGNPDYLDWLRKETAR